MSAWLSIVPAGLLALVVLFLPGLALGRVLRLRGFLWWGSAPLLSGGVIGTTAIVAPAVGLPWGLTTVAAGTGLGLVLAAVVRLVTRGAGPAIEPGATAERPGAGERAAAQGGTAERAAADERAAAQGRHARRGAVLVLAGLAVAAVLQTGRIVAALEGPQAISQTYDANYHLNAVQFILDRADASSLHMSMSNPMLDASFYPALWHGIVALLEGATAIGVPQATTALTIVVAAVVWPLAVAALARVLFGRRPWLVAASALLATSFTQFPELLTYYGVLYPNLIAYAMLPAFVALVVSMLWQRTVRGWVAHAALLAVGSLALTLGQTNALFAAAFILVPAVLYVLGQRSVDLVRRSARPGRAATLLALAWAVGIAAVAVAYRVADRVPQVGGLRSSPVYWPVDETVLGAVGSALTLAAGHPHGTPDWAMAALVLVGLVGAARVSRLRWLIAGHLVVVVLYVVSTSVDGALRSELTGYWYGDDHRLAALLPVTGIPLAVLGLRELVRRARGLLALAATRGSAPRHARRRAGAEAAGEPAGERGPRSARWVAPTGAAVLVLLVLAHTQVPAARQSFAELERLYRIDPTSSGSIGLLAANEYALLERLEEIVPEGVVVAGSPWDGSSMSWAVGGREALFPHISIVWTHDAGIIATRLNEARTDPEVCQAVENLNVGYVLDMAYPMWGGDPAGGEHAYPGLDWLVATGVAEPVAVEGPARLLEITACD
ncbi:DUF6541 family protein [Georgenia wangjunii]|uniref:DUF6541 family protein n=1 Tax=Georgenia wangjunii TaxID=3117730 RepID=UPI002F266A7E